MRLVLVERNMDINKSEIKLPLICGEYLEHQHE